MLSQIWIGALLEFVGGILITLGPCTRPVAFVFAGAGEWSMDALIARRSTAGGSR